MKPAGPIPPSELTIAWILFLSSPPIVKIILLLDIKMFFHILIADSVDVMEVIARATAIVTHPSFGIKDSKGAITNIA
jgi:hypothetical protein